MKNKTGIKNVKNKTPFAAIDTIYFFFTIFQL